MYKTNAAFTLPRTSVVRGPDLDLLLLSDVHYENVNGKKNHMESNIFGAALGHMHMMWQ